MARFLWESDAGAHHGMVRKVIGGHWPWSPRMQQMAARDEIEAHVLPGGVAMQLMREIATTHPYFVRCIKPNMSLAPDDFNGALVLRQFNCTGTTECVKLMQVGFPSRAPYEDLRSRFKASLPAEFGTMPSDRFVGLLLVACGGKEGDYQLGQDMVFFKASKGGMLAELMLIPKDEIASRIVEQSTKDVGLLDKELRDVLVKYIEQRKEERAVRRRRWWWERPTLGQTRRPHRHRLAQLPRARPDARPGPDLRPARHVARRA